MTRALAFSLLSTLWLFSADAQTPTGESKLSPHLRMLVSGDPVLMETARRTLPARPGTQRTRPAVGAFVKFQGDVQSLRAAMATYGAKLNTVVGNLATAEIPIDSLARVAGLNEVLQIEESRLVKPNTDVSVPATGANQIWYGAGGPVAATVTNRGAMPPPWQGNTGQGVLIGVVDTGIDLNHKDFIDAAGHSRIVALWDQTQKGVPPNTPAGYAAFTGNECTNAQIDAVRQNTDLAITNSFTGSMSVMPANGAGGFGPVTTFLKGHNSVSVAVADFDRDGQMDMITGNLDGTISWVQNQHGFYAPQNPITVAGATAQITAIGTGDFNQDGFPDVVAVVYNTNQIAILLGNGDGTFQPPALIPVGTNPDTVAVADVNADGFADLAIGNYTDGTITILLGDGKGNFSTGPNSPFSVSNMPANYPTGQFPSFIAIGDLNGDGKPDLAVADWGRVVGGAPNDALSIMLGNGDGTFGAPTTTSTGHFGDSIALGDFNGDGILDVVLESYSTAVTILLGHGDGTFGTPKDYPAGGIVVGLYTGQATLAVVDFNGDGILDIANLVRTNTPNGSFYDGVGVLLGNGDGTFGAVTVYPTNSGANSTYLAVGNFHSSSICTEVDLNGHGTQVTGIAAGNGSAGGPGPLQTKYRYIGMAPQASIIFVKTTFQDMDVVDGVAYLANKAALMGLPVAINLSLGKQVGPHDGTSSFETMISGLAAPGQIVVTATGNEADKEEHADGTLANGHNLGVGFTVPPNLTSKFQLDLWYPGQDTFGVTVNGPGGACMGGPLYPSNAGPQNFQSANCGTVNITAGPANAANGDHEVQIYISNGDNATPAGDWSIGLTGSGCGAAPCVTQGTFDIWTDGTCAGTNACVIFSQAFADNLKTLDEPSTATNVIAVGSYTTKVSWISWFGPTTPISDKTSGVLGELSTFSNQGPRRSCSIGANCPAVQKPDVAAPGEVIFSSYAAGTPVAVCGYTGGGCLDTDAQHIGASGTSLATPHVTGAVALMLEKYGNMSPCQVKTSLAAARVDSSTDATPNPAWGYGKLAIDLAIGIAPVKDTPVPSVVGLTLAAAQTAIATAGLPLGRITYSGSQTVPTGSVISQSPGPGGCGGTVSLVVTGVAVPDVVLDTQAVASAGIVAANLVVGTVTRAGSPIIPVGNVIRTDPSAGTYVAPGTTVNLVISGVPVPAVTGQTKAVALAAIGNAGLTAGAVTFDGSQTVPVGSIISQNPAAGTFVLLNSAVDLVVSGIKVPDIVGQALSVGQAVVTAVNLTVGGVTSSTSNTVPPGNIISETPSAGTYVDTGTPVALVVSGIQVPNVVGQGVNDAEAGLAGAGLAAGNVSQAASNVVPVGVVMAQNPAPGSFAAQGSGVDLLVSSGIGQLLVPNVVAFTQANAATAIVNTGLVVGVVTTAPSATVPAGKVISESPAAGSPVNANTAVNLVISGGVVLQSIAVTPANPSISPGGTKQFTATGTYTGNTTQDVTHQATWASDTTAAATITSAGLATGVAAGSSTISAKIGAIVGSTLLTVSVDRCDLSGDGTVTVADVQRIINEALGVSPPVDDLNGDGVVTVADVQIVVNAALGLGCSAH